MTGKKQKHLENQKSTRTHKNNMAMTMSGKTMAFVTTMLVLQEMHLQRDNWIHYMKKMRNSQIL
eukprot:12882126-Prorocentrum_lima.AAC.1